MGYSDIFIYGNTISVSMNDHWKGMMRAITLDKQLTILLKAKDIMSWKDVSIDSIGCLINSLYAKKREVS